MPKEIKSPAKLKVIEFIKNTKVGGDELFTFRLEGNKKYAEDFVHQMRVELSRMRREVKDKGHTVRMWKMIIEEIKPLDGATSVTLRRTLSANQQIANEVSDILEELVGGSKINVT